MDVDGAGTFKIVSPAGWPALTSPGLRSRTQKVLPTPVTSHSAQGLTADRVLINADTTAHAELLNTQFAYVSVSRARLDAEIYTNDAEGLAPRLNADLGKSAAIEFSESIGTSTARNFGMGQSI